MVSVCSVQREISGHKRKEVAGRWFGASQFDSSLYVLIITTKRMRSMCVAHLLT
jgi:hypothetical protein